MSNMSVDGLVSGLDTSSLVNQLMQLERAPQQRLQAKRDDTNRVLDLYRLLNTRFQAIETASDALSSTADWGLATATTSHDGLATATASDGAPEGTLSFRVNALARAHTVISTGSVADPAAAGVFSAGFSVAGVAIADVGDGSLWAVATAVNAAGAGVRASVVQTGSGQYRLQLTSETTGVASAFAVTGTGLEALGTVDSIVTEGRDAEISVGQTTPYTITSATNTLTDVLQGVTITLRAEDPATTVTVDVGADAGKLADRVQSLVTAVNDAAAFVRSNSTYNAATGRAGRFLADQLPSRLTSSLVSALTTTVDGTSLLASGVGIELSRDGAISFDRQAFLDAFAEDPQGVARLFTSGADGAADDGLAERLRVIADAATASTTGQITTAIESRTSAVTDLERQIDAWDDRLERKEQTLRRIYTAMETALGQARNQSTWLAGQLANLPGFGQ